ncbi:cytochrome c oxidase subunit 4 [soil metagenome]
MKLEGRLFTGVAVFLAIVTLIYWLLSRDPTGTTALALSIGLSLLIGFYLSFTARRIGERPEDRTDADVSDGAGDYGFFSPHSWWPLVTAASAAVATLGVVYDWWLFILGGSMLAVAAIGFVMEYYRGSFVEKE